MATNTSATGRDSDKFMLRFPDGMRDRISEAAKANNRSMNAEIVARLEASFDSIGNADEFMKELRFQTDLHAKQLKAAQLFQKLLASFLIQALATFPKDRQDDATYILGTQFADGILNEDHGAVVDAFQVLFPETEATADRLHKVLDKHNRGGDVTPEIEDHLSAERAKWDKTSTALHDLSKANKAFQDRVPSNATRRRDTSKKSPKGG